MKFLLGSAALVTCLLGVGLASTASPPPPPDVWPKFSVVATEGNSSSTRPFAEDCQEYCSCTYPEHTYPEPVNFKACASGCRSAQLDAFISWPQQTDPQKCGKACEEMYSDQDQRFACSTGCKTPTIDSAFPNRDHLYSQELGNWTAEIDIILPPIQDTISYLFSSFFGSPAGFDDLNEHAQNMEVLTVPYLRSDVTILTEDGLYSYREYSFDNGDPVFAPPSSDKEGESNSFVLPTSDPEMEEYWMSVYDRPGRSNCMWILHRAALNKMLLVFSVGLIMTALLACLLSSCKTNSPSKATEKVPPKVTPMKMTPQMSPPLPLVKKAPYNVEPVYAVPEKVKLDSVKITML